MNGWVNNGEAGDLRRHRAHYDVTVMVYDIVVQRYTNDYESNANNLGAVRDYNTMIFRVTS